MKILYLAFAELDIPNACRIHVVEVIKNFATLGHRVVAILPRPLTAVLFPEGVITSYVYPWNFSWYGKFLFNVLAGLRMRGPGGKDGCKSKVSQAFSWKNVHALLYTNLHG